MKDMEKAKGTNIPKEGDEDTHLVEGLQKMRYGKEEVIEATEGKAVVSCIRDKCKIQCE